MFDPYNLPLADVTWVKSHFFFYQLFVSWKGLVTYGLTFHLSGQKITADKFDCPSYLMSQCTMIQFNDNSVQMYCVLCNVILDEMWWHLKKKKKDYGNPPTLNSSTCIL